MSIALLDLTTHLKARGLYTNVTGMGGRPDRIVAHFLTSAPTLKECPPPIVPEVAIAGRSNSGKSSVLNQLTRNRQLARTSKTPGRTQLLNFFDNERRRSPGRSAGIRLRTRGQESEAHLGGQRRGLPCAAREPGRASCS